MKIKEFKATSIVSPIPIKISVYSKEDRGDLIIKDFSSFLDGDDLTYLGLKQKAREKTGLTDGSKKILEEILYYKGVRLNESFIITRTHFDFLEYEVYLESQVVLPKNT